MDTSDSNIDALLNKEDNLTTCPCCGKKTLPKPVKPKDELTDRWLSCVLSGVPFSNVYSLYDGRIQITITELTSEQKAKLSTAVQIVTNIESLPWDPKCPVNLLEIQQALGLFSAVQKIEVSINGKSATFTPANIVYSCADEISKYYKEAAASSIDDKLTEALKQWSSTLTNPKLISAVPTVMIAAAVATHDQLSRLLMDAGFDKNFWTGIELA